jgi:hypothetical protein
MPYFIHILVDVNAANKALCPMDHSPLGPYTRWGVLVCMDPSAHATPMAVLVADCVVRR